MRCPFFHMHLLSKSFQAPSTSMPKCSTAMQIAEATFRSMVMNAMDAD